MSYDDLFTQATRHHPFPYQHRLADTQSPLSPLLHIPTGAGKTPGVILAWLWRRRFADGESRHAVPRRLVYCLPMRVLVEQTRDVAVRSLHRLGLLAGQVHIADDIVLAYESDAADARPVEGWAQAQRNAGPRIAVHVLMGGEETDDWDLYPEREAILIGTQDMLLSRALNRGYGMSRYRWPMHFGLLNHDCLWVLDEVQLMGAGLATTAQLHAFRETFGTLMPVQSLWMSATLRPDWLATVDFKEAVRTFTPLTLGPEDRADARLRQRLEATKRLRKANVTAADPPQKIAQGILKGHRKGSLTLVVVNTVERARHLYEAVRTLTRRRRGDPEPFLIHSLFRPPDREERHNRLALAHRVFRGEPLSPLDDETDAWVARVRDVGLVVIATQVVEAGVDLSATTLFTELAPWPSLVQRFGRCNRFGEVPEAIVFWIDLPTGGRKSLAPPYAADELDGARTIIESTDLDDVSPSRLEAYLQTLPDEARGALFPYAPTHVIRQHDLHGLFSTEPDLAGGFTDISPFVRDREQDLHVYVAWRHFERTVPTADQPLVRREEICPVPVYELAAFLGNKGAAWEWNDEVGTWERRWPPEIRPGMLLLLHAAQGGYHRELGWTGRPADRPAVSEHLGVPSDSLRRDPLSHTDWVLLVDHLEDVEAEARRLVRDLGLDQAPEGNAVILAGQWHDIGKLHLGWQGPLREAAPPEHAGPWAKFKGVANFRPPVRHEAVSALAAWSTWRHGVDGWSALAVYLVAAHHGKVRTVLRSLEGGEDVFGIRPGETLPPLSGWLSTEQSLDLRPKAFGAIGEWEDASGTFSFGMPSWVGMVVELLGPELPGDPSPSAAVPPDEPRSLGPFRLAFLEMVVRAADARASRRPGGGRQG